MGLLPMPLQSSLHEANVCFFRCSKYASELSSGMQAVIQRAGFLKAQEGGREAGREGDSMWCSKQQIVLKLNCLQIKLNSILVYIVHA